MKDGKGTAYANAECIVEHLEQIRINYEQKDKFIRDDVVDIADLFNEIARRNFANYSLGFYYQVDEQEGTKKKQARRLTTLNNWLLKIVVERCRSNGYTAMDYILRFFEISRILK